MLVPLEGVGVCVKERARESGRERDSVFQTLPKSITIESLG